MSRLLRSFPELPLKRLANGTIADSYASLQLPAPSPRAASLTSANPLVQLTRRPRAPFAHTDGWHHGGINE